MIPLSFNSAFFGSHYLPRFPPLYTSPMMGFNMFPSLMMPQQQTFQPQIHPFIHMMKTHFHQTATIPQKLDQNAHPMSNQSLVNSSSSSSYTKKSPEVKSSDLDLIKDDDREKLDTPETTKISNQKKNNPDHLKTQLAKMIYELLDKLGKIDQDQLDNLKISYAHNPKLLPIFDIIVAKCLPVKKHREDIVRYIIRKTFKFFKADIIKKDKIYGKRAYAMLCKKYFQFSPHDLENLEIDMEDERNLIEVLLPYRKNSKNRTMNINFTAEIFSSKEFCEDYNRFLAVFNKVLNDDNSKKVEKLIELAETCVAMNCTEKIKKCTRLPWLEVWMEKTRETAFDLPKLGVLEKIQERVDSEEESVEDHQINKKRAVKDLKKQKFESTWSSSSQCVIDIKNKDNF